MPIHAIKAKITLLCLLKRVIDLIVLITISSMIITPLELLVKNFFDFSAINKYDRLIKNEKRRKRYKSYGA